MNVIALGLFDGLHLGHMAVINAMLAIGGNHKRCVFTFNTDCARPCAKPAARLMSLSARNSILKAAGIDSVFEPDFEDIRDIAPEAFAKEILAGRFNAAHVFCGGSFRFGKGAAACAGDLQAMLPNAIEAHIVETVMLDGEPVSTTRIRGLIQSGDMGAAARLLGRAFMIDFPVIAGNRIGRTLNMPTINQAFPEQFVLPRFGVYASIATVDGKRYKGVTNVGVKPTVGGGGILAETYIDGYSGDLYGKQVPVELLGFIRPERKFESLGALKEQIMADLVTRLALK